MYQDGFWQGPLIEGCHIAGSRSYIDTVLSVRTSGRDAMTSPGQPGQAPQDSNQPPQEAHEPPRQTRRRPAGRFSLPRNKGTWFWIMVSLIALAGVALVVVGGGSHQATSGGTPAADSGSKAKGKVPSAAQVAESGGALSLPANMQGRVIAWHSGPGGAHLEA